MLPGIPTLFYSLAAVKFNIIQKNSTIHTLARTCPVFSFCKLYRHKAVSARSRTFNRRNRIVHPAYCCAYVFLRILHQMIRAGYRASSRPYQVLIHQGWYLNHCSAAFHTAAGPAHPIPLLHCYWNVDRFRNTVSWSSPVSVARFGLHFNEYHLI